MIFTPLVSLLKLLLACVGAACGSFLLQELSFLQQTVLMHK